MSTTDSSDFKLFRAALARIREKGIESAKPLLAEFSERRVAKAKAKVANDVT
jgi:hypothetical protein